MTTIHRQTITNHQPPAKFRLIVAFYEDPAKDFFTSNTDECREKFCDEISTLNFIRRREKLGQPKISPGHSAKFYDSEKRKNTNLDVTSYFYEATEIVIIIIHN